MFEAIANAEANAMAAPFENELNPNPAFLAIRVAQLERRVTELEARS